VLGQAIDVAGRREGDVDANRGRAVGAVVRVAVKGLSPVVRLLGGFRSIANRSAVRVGVVSVAIGIDGLAVLSPVQHLAVVVAAFGARVQLASQSLRSFGGMLALLKVE